MDLTINCIIEFTESVFTGNYPKAKFSHERKITGTILKESYGAITGQHTFTIEIITCDDESYVSGDKIRRKGRNVYKNCKVLSYPTNHTELADEKHERSKDTKLNIRAFKALEKGNILEYKDILGVN